MGFSFFCVPQLHLWGSFLDEIFVYVTVFLIQPLRYSHSIFVDGACWVFLLLAFTCLGHECQDLLSPCDGMHVCTDSETRPWFILSFERVWGGMKLELTLTPREKIACTGKKSQRRLKPMMLHQSGQRAQHTTNKLFWSHWWV